MRIRPWPRTRNGLVEGMAASDTSVQIGARLRQLRLREGLTQEEMADRLRMSQPQVSRLESGGAWTSVAKVIDAILAAGFDPMVLLSDDPGLSAEELALLKAVRRLDPEQRRALLVFLRA